MTVEERITRLEKTNRVWKLATTGLALAMLAIAVTSCEQSGICEQPGNSGTSEIIRTKRLEIMNPLGKPVVTLCEIKGEGGCLGILNSQGKLVLTLGGIEGKGGFLWICNSQGKPVVTLEENVGKGGCLGILNS